MLKPLATKWELASLGHPLGLELFWKIPRRFPLSARWYYSPPNANESGIAGFHL